MHKLGIAILLAWTAFGQQPQRVEQWGVFEVSLRGPAAGNPFLDVRFGAEFKYKNRVVAPDGFYDGDGVYRVRFMPDAQGTWTYVTRSNSPELDGKTGEFLCVPPEKGNRGPVVVRNTYHFGYADGTPYFPVGTTCYAWAHQGDKLEEQTLATLRAAPFNKMRMCVFPKDYVYNKNEPVYYPFERDAAGHNDLTRFNPKFFQHFEQRVKDLLGMGIEADLILFHPYDRWGYKSMPAEADDRYLRYTVARLAAFRNVWWSMANEFDFMKEKTTADWDRFFRIVQESDPYQRLRSIHNGAVIYDHGKPWVTHASIQSADFDKARGWREAYRKPVIYDECQYEGNIPRRWGNISAQEMVRRFWLGTTDGAYVGHGETYLDPNDILWWSKGGVLHGESASRIAFLRRILEEGPAQGINPREEKYRVAGIEGRYYLYYFDVHQPGEYEFDLAKGVRYKVEIIDPWEMTIAPVDGTFEGKFTLKLPSKPYLAVRVVGQASAGQQETKQQRDARMAWWREARFGMFIHWGIYSVPAGTYHDQQIPGIGEWIMNRGKIPAAEYATYAGQFNPVKFDAEKWVLLARQAGMKYIVITSKHHDGFAMFQSRASGYNVVDATPFKRDVIREIAEACQKHGMKLGLYYSQAQDWHHPGGAAMGGHWDKAQDGSMDEYIDKVAVPQVREILSNYGRISVLWWDTPADMTEARAAKLYPLLKLQPGIITNNRLGGGFPGDLTTPEQFIPSTGIPGKDWETCMTMNDTWGFKSYDHNWKSGAELIRNLADIASKGGNFLLNVGPTSEGVIPEASVERLQEMGRWMKVNSEAIYGTTAGPFPYLKWGRATRKGQTLYLHVFNWPSDGVLRVPLNNKVRRAYLLADPSKTVAAKLEAERIVLKLPAKAPDPVASVVALEIEGEPVALPVPSLGKSGRASSVLGPEFGAEKAFDGDHETRWRAGKGERTAWLEVTLDKPARIGRVDLIEGWESESFTRKFRLEYKDGEQWKTVFEGTRIGRAFSREFQPVTARTFRLNILEATGAPQIEEMQLLIDE